MSRNYGLCLGLNFVSKEHYGTAKGLATADDSAKAIHDLIESSGGSSTFLANKEANYANVTGQMKKFASTLRSGDSLHLVFCGHSIKIVEDTPLDAEAVKYKDRGWCLYDQVMFFFESWELLRSFATGVKIIIISDTCYSGILGMEGGLDKKPKVQWFDQACLYNYIIKNSHRPLEYQVPSSVLILSASSKFGDSYETMGKFTVFIDAIINSISDVKDKKYNYFQLFSDAMIRVSKQRPKQSPRWHYVQGHKNTMLPYDSVFDLNFEKISSIANDRSVNNTPYSVISHSFNPPEDQLDVHISNPNNNLEFEEARHIDLPSDVTFNPSDPFWVHQDNHHLIITLNENGISTPNPYIVSATRYYNDHPKKDLDVVTEQKKPDGTKKTKRVKRALVPVKQGGGGVNV